MSEPHQIVKTPTFAPVLKDTERCPACLMSWRGNPIPEESRHLYSEGKAHFSKLIGVELPNVFDGVHHWQCPYCNTTFPRWHEKNGQPTRRMFSDDLHL